MKPAKKQSAFIYMISDTFIPLNSFFAVDNSQMIASRQNVNLKSRFLHVGSLAAEHSVRAKDPEFKKITRILCPEYQLRWGILGVGI